MASTSEKVLQLRQMLAERFGEPDLCVTATYQTGLPALDDAGIPAATITEIVSAPSAGPGGALLLYGLLRCVLEKGDRVALIDAKNAFQPKALPQLNLDRLLWTRCENAGEALKVADLVVRDGNLPLVILHLALNPASELKRIPGTAWHRLQMLAEKSAVPVLIFTPRAQVGCARLRLEVGGAFPLQKIHRSRNELLPNLNVRVERRRITRERGCSNEDLRRSSCA